MDCCDSRFFPTALGPFPRVIDTIRNPQVQVSVRDAEDEITKYSVLISHFGKPSIIQDTRYRISC